MELSEQAQLIDHIKETLDSHLGETIYVEQNLGRSRINANIGTIMQVHPRLFILEVERKRAPKAKISYQFADILTGIVKIKLNGEELFEDYQELLAIKKEIYDPTLYEDEEKEEEERILS